MNLELLDSKNWKDRSSFYTSLTWHTSDISILKKLSQETTVPALESCLNAIISYPNSDYENSKQILKNINNIKLKPLFIKYFIKHFDSSVIDDIINSIQTIKLAKTVVIYCEILQRLVEHYNISFDLKVLEYVLKHGDPNVRKEGISLCVYVYKIEGDNIFRYLQNVKEMQIKEIKERIEGNSKESNVKSERSVAKNIETVVENTRTVDTKDKAVSMKEEYKPTEMSKVTKKEQLNRPVEKTLPVDQNIKPFLRNYRNIERYNEPTDLLITQLKNTNYKDRIEALTTIQDTPVSLNSEIESIIITKVNDVNLQVTTLAIECCVLLRNNKEVVKALCERLKDKRLKNVIFYVMKELKIQNMDIFEAIDFSKCKNPIMKVSLLEYMKYERFETYQVEGIVLMTSDGNKDVREGAFECCKAIYNTKHRNLLPAKIQEKLAIESGNENCETTKVENVIVEEKIQKSVLIEDGSLEYFFAKYPVLKNISSTKRCEDIAKSDITNDKYFIKFCILYTDSYYKVNEYLIDECMRKGIPSENYHELIFAFLSKLGDSKLRMKIKELIIYLYNKESNETIKALRNFLESKKAGTLFCAAMTIYGEIGALQDILYLESLDQTGKNEKDAIYASIKNIKDRNAQLSIATENSSICKKQVNVNKRKHFVTKSAIIKQKISNRPKDCKNKEILFTDEFTSMLASKSDYKKVLMLFEQEDMLSLSDYIIEYFDKHDLLTVDYDYAKKYINNLISYFIDKEYILKEIEARMLCGILKNEKEMVLKLPLIYPKSKLEKLMVKQNDFDSMNASFLSMKVENSFINSPCKKSKRDVKFENISNLRPFACAMKMNDNERVQEIKPQNEYANTNNDSIHEYNKSMPMDTQNSSFVLDKATLEKYSFEMSQYKTVSTNVDRLALERILADLIDSKCQRSEKAFKDLNTIIDSNVASLYFSRNAIVSSIIMQLSESILTKNKFSSFILSTLLKLCKDVGFVSDLSTNAIQTINIDMINIIRDEKNNETPNTANLNLASDILLAICSNGDHVVVFKTYLSLFDTITGDARKLLYKLICKHAKHTKSICDEKPKVQEIIDALNVFLEKNCLKIIKNDVVAIKVIQLHINEYCLYFRDRIYEFRLEGLVGRIVDKTMGKVKVEIEDVKRRIDELQKQ